MSHIKLQISIIIPAKNGAKTIDRVLAAIFNQATNYNYEVIVIDSGSTDQTLDILKKYPVILHQILPEEFSHSKTRNMGASLSTSEKYILFLNQDAVPTDNSWLNNMVHSIEFESEPKAVCATELIEGLEYFNVTGVASYLFRNSAMKGIYTIEPCLLSKTTRLSREQQRELFPFTTVCAIFNKAHFVKYPFNEEVEWGEDLCWAVENSNRGFTSACTSLATVYHHHDYPTEEINDIYKRTDAIYKKLFNINFNKEVCHDPSNTDTKLHEVYNSLSWRITQPLRTVCNILTKLTRTRH